VRNLRGRLTLGVTAVLAVVLALAGVLVARDVDNSERDGIDDSLRRTAELSRATAVAAVEQELPGGDRRLEDVLRATGSSLRLTVGKRVVLEAGSAPPLRVPLGLHTVEHVRTYAERLRAPGLSGLARLEATRSLRPLERRQADRHRRLALILGATLLAAAIGVWFAADLVLRPLRRLRAATARIATEQDLEAPVDVGGPTELRSLAQSFNAMLGRLRRSAADRTRALDATRRFAADAGHELRTPLTSVQATLSALARHPTLDADKRTAMAVDALAEQRRLVDLLDGLQALARGDAAHVEQTDVELSEIVDGAVAAARVRWPRTAFAAELPSEDVVRRGWEAGLRMLVDNLVANAANHGRAGGTVRVTLSPTALVVEDDGPGIPAADRERVLEPFARVGSSNHPGSGLGLALVAQQARLHDATIAIDDSPQLGGARVTISWPA
jgi:signal transduction histidine kinase